MSTRTGRQAPAAGVEDTGTGTGWTVVGPDATFKGDLAVEGSVRIVGRVEGRITAKGEVAVAPGAVATATIDATVVTIEGTVQGDVVARERVTLTARGVLKGDVATVCLNVEEGATLVGHCRVGPEALAAAEETAVEVKGRSRAAAPEWAREGGAPPGEWSAPAGKPSWLAGLSG